MKTFLKQKGFSDENEAVQTILEELKTLIKNGDILDYSSFESLWDQIGIINAYEDDWEQNYSNWKILHKIAWGKL